MAVRYRPCRVRRCAAPGFTMIEMIVALAVMGVATSIFVSLFRASLDMASTGSRRMVAAQLAEAQLQDILHYPENYVWYLPEVSDAALFEVKASEEDPPVGVALAGPSIAPGNETAFRRNERLYKAYTWKAYGRYPRIESGELFPDPAYLEVVLELRWKEDGRDQVLALTSAVAFDPARLPRPAPEPLPIQHEIDVVEAE